MSANLHSATSEPLPLIRRFDGRGWYELDAGLGGSEEPAAKGGIDARGGAGGNGSRLVAQAARSLGRDCVS
eukprot:5712922-Prymnesium_polylepis.1